MSAERMQIPTITIGVDRGEQVATVAPSAVVVEAHTRVQFRLADDVHGTAKVMLPAEGVVVSVVPGESTPVEVTQTGVYYTVVTLKNPGKVAAMAVLICEV